MQILPELKLSLQILCSVDPKYLRLTPIDELIYKAFREEFPKLDVKIINEDELKSKESKEKWRPFCEKFKNCVEDYSYGTLLRADASRGYDENNSILVTRIQFYAIELARNWEGVNDSIRKRFSQIAKTSNEVKEIV